LEDKIGKDVSKPLLINQEGLFYCQREGVETMDMGSDMGDGDMSQITIFGSTKKIHPSLPWCRSEKSNRRNKPE
jgi:hypothetical protein